MARNPNTGEVWFGVEDQGVYRYDPRAKPEDQYESGRWSNFRTGEGLGDNNAYALAIDPKGRVWAGTRAHGVSVFNGTEWQAYDVLSGPLGERVFDLAVSPLDGDVWIATNRGLTRYSQKSDTWKTWTRTEGLPSDQIQTIAFAKDGTLFVGTQCDGLAIGKVGDDYKSWRLVQGPDQMPQSARGSGLPSNLLNDLLVARDGTVYLATDGGLARSRDNGATWQFLRGRDYADKVHGQYKRPEQPGIQEVHDADMAEEAHSNLLLEDYVTTLAEDEAGRIWVGHPTQGIEARTPGAEELAAGGVLETLGEWRRLLWQHRRVVAANPLEQEEKTDFVMSILPIPGQGPLVSAYGAGAVQLKGAFFDVGVGGVVASDPLVGPALQGPQFSAWPSPASPPSAEELRALAARIQALAQPAPPAQAPLQSTPSQSNPLPEKRDKTATPAKEVPEAVVAGTVVVSKEPAPVSAAPTPVPTPDSAGATFVGDDWITGGDWMGRYGTRYAFLGAMGAPLDHRIVNDLAYSVEGRIGPHPYQDGKSYEEQNLRHWCHAERWDDPRVLYNPLIGYRRQADVDDNGETYPLSYEGPDVWMGVRVPPGVHRVALYFFNKDGHNSSNRIRDYVIEVKRGHDDLLQSEAEPTLAKARVRDFWGGVYKVFTLDGGTKGGDYYFWLRKNTTFNVIVQAVLIDKVAGPPTPWEERRDVFLGESRFEAPSLPEQEKIEQAALQAVSATRKPDLEAAIALWHAVGTLRIQPPSVSTDVQGQSYQKDVEPYRILARLSAYRAASIAVSQTKQGAALLHMWRWTLPLWPQEDRAEFTEAMKKGWDSFTIQNPEWTKQAH